MSQWHLPVSFSVGERIYAIHADFRDILEIFTYLEDPDLPEYLRWEIAMALFYKERIPEEHRKQALEFLIRFICCGEKNDRPGPKLIDWQTDAMTIVSDINKVAGQEVRSLPFLHWWTFMSWFHSIGEGQLSTIVGIRDKLHRGKKLENWEKEFYRENKQRVDMKKRYSQEELREQEKWKALLD